MTPEIYAIGFAVTILTSLIGVIWKQLNARVDGMEKDAAEALEKMQKAFNVRVSEMERAFYSRMNERFGEQNNRLTAGSTRMDLLLKEISDLKVKLAEDYHDGNETRVMVGDLLAPLTQQLQRIENNIQQLARK